MPSGATWVRGGAREFHPDENYVVVEGVRGQARRPSANDTATVRVP